MKLQSLKHLLFAVAMTPLTLSANTQFSDGDLILYFQQEGGSDTIYVDLGDAATVFRGAATGPDAGDSLNIIDISSELTTAFGPGWASDPDLYVGLAACRATATPLAVNGDPGKTIYISNPRPNLSNIGSAAGSLPTTVASDTLMAAASGAILSMNSPFAGGADQQVGIFPTGTSFIDDQNPFLAENIQGTAFTAIPGGVQQVGSITNMGSVTTQPGLGTIEFALDLERIYGDTFGLDPNRLIGPLREGTYEGTVVVGTDGSVSFISTAASGGSVKVDSIITGPGTLSGTKVTIAFTATGDIDVYSSTDLQTWSSPIAEDVSSSPFIHDDQSDDKRFYVLVPAGETYPPAE